MKLDKILLYGRRRRNPQPQWTRDRHRQVSIHALVNIGLGESGFGLSAELKSDIPRMAKNDAQSLVDAAHQMSVFQGDKK